MKKFYLLMGFNALCITIAVADVNDQHPPEEILSPHIKEKKLVLSLRDIVLYALKHHRSLPQWQTDIQASRSLEKDAGLLSPPDLNLSHQSDEFSGGNGKRTTSISVHQSIPMGQKRSIERKNAAQAVSNTQYQAQENLRNLIESLELACATYNYLQLKKDNQNNMLIINQRLFEFLNSKAQQGEVSPIDVGEAQLELDIIKQNSADTDLQSRDIHFELQSLMGLQSGETLQILSNNANNQWDRELPMLNAQWLEHPLVHLAQGELNLSKNEIQSLQAQRWGDLKVGLSYELEITPTLSGTDREHSLGFEIEFPWPMRRPFQGHLESNIVKTNSHQLSLINLMTELHQKEQHYRSKHQNLKQQLKNYDNTLIKSIARNLELNEQAYAQGRIDLDRLMRMHAQYLDINMRRLELSKELQVTEIQWYAITAMNLIQYQR